MLGAQTDSGVLALSSYHSLTAALALADEEGHGSHTAGVAGAVGNNALGVTGVAWNVSLLICKAAAGDAVFYSSSTLDCYSLCKGVSLLRRIALPSASSGPASMLVRCVAGLIGRACRLEQRWSGPAMVAIQALCLSKTRLCLWAVLAL